MFDFERLFICKEFRVEKGGISAEGIGFSHPSNLTRLLVFGHVLTPSVERSFRYTLTIEQASDNAVDSIGTWPYTLVPTARQDRRILLAWIPVNGVLAPGAYDAIIEVESSFQVRTGFEVV